jgi:hypothetical protein
MTTWLILMMLLSQPQGCTTDLDCCQRYDNCDADFMADVKEGEQK